MASEETWKIPSVIALAALSGFISLICWFLNNSYNDQKSINKILFQKNNELEKSFDAYKVDVEKRLAVFEYTCCRAKNGRYQ